MGGSLVTVLILLILDLVVCTPRIQLNSRYAKTLEKTSNRHKLNNEATENTEAPDEYPLTDYDNAAVHHNVPVIHQACHDENGCKEQLAVTGRSLRAGDTFTPQEMLPIAKELLKKVHNDVNRGLNVKPTIGVGDYDVDSEPPVHDDVNKGINVKPTIGVGDYDVDSQTPEGKGIVSSASHPQVLADILFESYFMTMNRIVTLKPNDIPGLDALQALSLSGNIVNLKNQNTNSKSITVSPNNKYGEQILSSGPEISKYNVVTKQPDGAVQRLTFGGPDKNYKSIDNPVVTKNEYEALKVSEEVNSPRQNNQNLKFRPPGPTRLKKIIDKRRFSIRELADKTLAKKRKLVIKARRQRRNQRLKMKKHVSRLKKRKGLRQRKPKSKQSKTAAGRNTKDASNRNEVCRWRYLCTDPADQRTCHVSPDCITNNKNDKYIGVRNVKNAKILEKFRRMTGIDPIDEEVEKILERHALSIQAQEKDALKIETLGEYFNKLMKREEKKAKSATTPIAKKYKK